MDLADRIKLSKNFLFLLGGAVVLLVLFGSIFISGKPRSAIKTAPGGEKITEVTIENEDTKLTIKRSGLVEIASGDKVFYQFWEQERVDRLFKLLENADFGGFDSRLKPGEQGYLLRLTTDQGVITIAIPDDSEFIPDVVQELIELLETISEELPESSPGASSLPLPSFFASPTPTPIPTPLPSPTPTLPPLVLPTPTPNPTAGTGGGIIPQEPFVCEYTGVTGRFRILSETLCDL